MKETGFSLRILFIVSFVLLLSTGCEKKENNKSLPEVNATDTQVFTSEDLERIRENKEKSQQPPKEISSDLFHAYTLKETTGQSHLLSLNNQKLQLHTSGSTVVVLNFFNTGCQPCIGMLPYLSDLQAKYDDKLLVIGVLLNDTLDENSSRVFKRKYNADIFISLSQENEKLADELAGLLQMDVNFTLPLTVVYKNGDYFIHYEGATPVEMLEHDLDKIIE